MKISAEPAMAKYLRAIRDQAITVRHGLADPNYPDSRLFEEFISYISGVIKVAILDTNIHTSEFSLLLRYRSMIHHLKRKAWVAA